MRTTFLFAMCVLACVVTQPGCVPGGSRHARQRTLDRYVEFWNTGKFDGIETVLHPEFELRMSPRFEPEKGLEAFKAHITRLRAAYPDFHLAVQEVVWDEGKKIRDEWIGGNDSYWLEQLGFELVPPLAK